MTAGEYHGKTREWNEPRGVQCDPKNKNRTAIGAVRLRYQLGAGHHGRTVYTIPEMTRWRAPTGHGNR